MAMFGNFYERIRGSVEFLASESLNYILNESSKANENLVKLLNREINIDYRKITFQSQVQGDNLEIPDVSGFDESRKEVIILETKFWASLTANQPMTYLERLPINGVLAFICPNLRTISLKSEIETVFQEHGKQFDYKDNDKKIISIDNKFIVIYTWESVLNNLKNDMDSSDFDILSDINQLKGLCERIDTNSFLPITQNDLAPEIPRKILSYISIIDKIIDKLAADKEVNLSTQGLKTTPQRWGYRRYAKIDNLTVSLDMNLDAWAKHADTPIWMEIGENWKVTDTIHKINSELEKKYGKINYADALGHPYYPIRLKVGEIEDKVIESAACFVKEIYELYKTIK